MDGAASARGLAHAEAAVVWRRRYRRPMAAFGVELGRLRRVSGCAHKKWVRHMSVGVKGLLSGDAAFSCAQQSLQTSYSFDTASLAAVRATFDSVWRQIANEVSPVENAAVSVAAAEAILVLAHAGLQPEHIRRLALSRLRHTMADKADGLATQASRSV